MPGGSWRGRFRILNGYAIRPDFYLPELDVYIEYWGMDTIDYKIGMLKKKQLYQQEGKRLISVFPEDKRRAVREYARVTRPCGYVGLNEATWLKTPPPPEIIEWASQDLGACVKPLTPDEWVGLLEEAGLTDIVVNVREVRPRREAKGLVRRYGYWGMLRSLYRALSLFLRSPAYRRFVKDVQKEGITPDNLEEYMGYGLFVGRKG